MHCEVAGGTRRDLREIPTPFVRRQDAAGSARFVPQAQSQARRRLASFVLDAAREGLAGPERDVAEIGRVGINVQSARSEVLVKKYGVSRPLREDEAAVCICCNPLTLRPNHDALDRLAEPVQDTARHGSR